MNRTIAGVGVLDKAMAIVDTVEFHPMSASEIAEALELNLSTTHRLAMALTQHGLLARAEDGRFRLGVRFDMSTMAQTSRPFLAQLTEQTSETTQLWVRRGEYRLCLEAADSAEELRVTLHVGWMLPLAEGGSAGLVLAGEPTRLADGTDPGWIESISQRTVGLGSVSAPVRVRGEIVAAICLAAPLPRVESSPGQQWGHLVAAAADALGSRLSR